MIQIDVMGFFVEGSFTGQLHFCICQRFTGNQDS